MKSRFARAAAGDALQRAGGPITPAVYDRLDTRDFSVISAPDV
jgi:hypothetical protein